MKYNLQKYYNDFKYKFLKSGFGQDEIVYIDKNNKITKSYAEAEIINKMEKDLKNKLESEK